VGLWLDCSRATPSCSHILSLSSSRAAFQEIKQSPTVWSCDWTAAECHPPVVTLFLFSSRVVFQGMKQSPPVWSCGWTAAERPPSRSHAPSHFSSRVVFQGMKQSPPVWSCGWTAAERHPPVVTPSPSLLFTSCFSGNKTKPTCVELWLDCSRAPPPSCSHTPSHFSSSCFSRAVFQGIKQSPPVWSCGWTAAGQHPLAGQPARPLPGLISAVSGCVPPGQRPRGQHPSAREI